MAARKRKAPAVQTYKKILNFSDTHVPYQAKPELGVLCDFKKDFKPKLTVCLGDIFDNKAMGRWPYHPDEYDQMDEILTARDILDRTMVEGDIMVFGNHDEWPIRPGKFPADLVRLLHPAYQLELRARKIKWFPWSSDSSEIYRVGKMSFIHGFAFGAYAGKREAQDFGCVVHGHTHRAQIMSAPNAHHKQTAFNIGCLCERLPYQNKRSPLGHTKGFGFGYFKKSGNFSYYVVRLINGSVFINDKEYNW